MRPLSPSLLALCAACSPQSDPPLSLPGEGESRVAATEPESRAAELAIPAEAPTVAVLGDSIAAGLHLDLDQAFPAVVQRELAGRGRAFHLVNGGVSGDTSAGGLRRVDWLLSQKPQVLVVELGCNDGLRGQDLADIESNLRGIVRAGKAGGALVVLLGMQVPPSLGLDYSLGFEELYQRVAQNEGARFVPRFLAGVGGVADLNLEDGMHPSADGQRRLAATLAPVLIEVLDELANR